MSLEQYKVNVSSTERTPEEIYDIYTNNEDFKNCLADTLIAVSTTLKEYFKDVPFSIHGRIKSKDSFLKKCDIKNNNIYDIYAFKIIIHNVPEAYNSSSSEVIKAKNNLTNLKTLLSNTKNTEEINDINKKIEFAQDDLNVAVSREIADFLVADNSPFLAKTNAKNLSKMRDHHHKSNGYISEHFCIERKPDTKYDINCRIETQVISTYRNDLSKKNHAQYKLSKNRPDETLSIINDLINCKSMEELNKICERVPTYFYLREDKNKKEHIYIASKHASILQFCYTELFEYDKENGKLKYQQAIDNLNSLYEDNKLFHDLR